MSKKQAMHVAAKQVLQVIGQPTSEGENDTPGVTPTKTSPSSKVLPAIASGKNPVMIMNEVYPNAEYSLVSENGDGMTKSFVVSVLVEGQTFTGTGRSKRQAKAYAAQAALSELHGVACLPSAGTILFSSLSTCLLLQLIAYTHTNTHTHSLF